MTYEEELEKAKERYRKSLLASGIGQASEQIGAAIAGVEKPKDNFYSKLGANAYQDVAEVKGKIKEDQKMNLLQGKISKDTKTQKKKQTFDLRKEFRAGSKDTKDRMRAYQDILSATKRGTGADDIKLITSFMKVLDPSSVVREGEFKTAADAGSFLQKTTGLFKRAAFGERLTEKQRTMFKVAARDMVKDSLADLRDDINIDYKPLIKSYDLNQNDIVNPKFMEKLRQIELEEIKEAKKRTSGNKMSSSKPKRVSELIGKPVKSKAGDMYQSIKNNLKERIKRIKEGR